MRKLHFILFGILFSIASFAETSFTLVLDPGHGGKDPGAVGKISKEKDLNLKLALRVGTLIKEQYPDVNVVYTRSTDVFIPLQTRADIANKNNANLFISIHANSSESKQPRGVETFILGTEKLEKNLDVAMRENAVMKLEADYKTTYQGFDPNSIDSYIMFELMQNVYLDQSLQFATLVQNQFVGQLNRDDRGVRQAAFWVLLKSACPSILFEMGFISNPEEERFLNQDASMTQMAQTIVNAFGIYARKNKVAAEEKEKLDKLYEEEIIRQYELQNEKANDDHFEKEADKPKRKVIDKEKGTDNIVSDQKRDNSKSNSNHASTTNKTVYYAVQICASRSILKANDPKLKGLKCDYIKVGNWYKYYTEIDTDRGKVAASRKRLQPLFPDCWIITIEK